MGIFVALPSGRGPPEGSPKICQLERLIEWLNTKDNTTKLLPLDSSSLMSNAWLAGFIDGDGGFFIGYILNSGQIYCRFRIEQRQNDPNTDASYAPIMGIIASFLGSHLNLSKHNNPPVFYYVVAATSPPKLAALVSYLIEFPLMSSKRLDFLAWNTALSLIYNKLHLTQEGRATILQLKASMNNARKTFTWDHEFLY
jgi:hypothetical protein